MKTKRATSSRQDLLIVLDDVAPRTLDDLVPVAKLGKTWGVRGALIVRLYNPDSELEWADADMQWVRGETFSLAPVSVDKWFEKGGKLLLQFDGVRSPQAAKALTGLELLAPAELLPALEDPDEVYVHELKGMEVVDDVQGSLGTIRDVFQTGANDVWIVRKGKEETLIPAIKDVVLDIDRDARRITVHYEVV